MKKGTHRIHIRKEALKFSSAHMTVFADGSKERIHGHNYRTKLSLDYTDASLKNLLPFSELKQAMRRICEALDEKFLLATDCPFLAVASETAESIRFSLCGKTYELPADEVAKLRTDNITTETLSQLFLEQLLAAVGEKKLREHGVSRVELKIEEMLGQGASYEIAL